MCGVAHADVYRWVDEKGEAHYTDRWVPGSELIRSSKPRPASPESNPSPSPAQAKASSVVTAAQSATSKLQQEQAQQAVKQDVAKTKEAQCKQAKERYQKAIEARRLYKTSKGGGDEDRTYMTDEEADAYRLQARNDVTLTCGSPPAPAQPE
jgi:hypothetical protein